MILEFNGWEAVGSPAWCSFCRFVIENLNDQQIFHFPPEWFLRKYPEHTSMLEALCKPAEFSALLRNL